MSEAGLMAWGVVAVLARITFWIAFVVDIAIRWGEPLIMVATTATVIWAVAWLLSVVGLGVLRANGAK